ncbi:ankyrin repeat-containing domain protein [Mycena vulgaris]|nr:ankyrin repeat-containing domain protein [Mycena vulgaris]
MIEVGCIPSDPDISGIGVRAAIYIQNLLSFIPAIWALWDGTVSDYELESVETQSTTILLTAFAILISTMVRARTLGISNFHGSIVLSLSWMNNTNTFIYFLLYVQHKSQPGLRQIQPTLSAWINHLLEQFFFRVANSENSAERQEHGIAGIEADSRKFDAAGLRSKRAIALNRSSLKILFKRIVLSLGSFHLSMMAALGIWLWIDPASFGKANICAYEHGSTTILGNIVPLRSHRLRSWSLAIYSLFLLPGVNLMLPMGLFLWLFVAYQSWHQRRQSTSSGALNTSRHTTHDRSAPNADSPLQSGRKSGFRQTTRSLTQLGAVFRAWKGRLPSFPSIVPVVIGMAILFAINLIFLVDIELTLRRNRNPQDVADAAWTFGQILAMLLLVMPLRDLLETIFERREKRRRDEHTASLRNAVKGEASEQTLLDLITNGADVNTRIEDCAWATALQLASFRGESQLMTVLLTLRGNPDIQGGKYGTALQAAFHGGHMWTVELLLARGADPNITHENYGTVLQSASKVGSLGTVKLLLQHGANPNIQGGQFGTALKAASHSGCVDIAEVLLSKGAEPNFQGGRYGTPLLKAALSVHHGHINWNMVRLLVNHKADINVLAIKGGTALHAASRRGDGDMVQFLLERGADPNIQDPECGTALVEASLGGHVDVVKSLLEVQALGSKTALYEASQAGHVEVVKVLLAQGVDPNVQGGLYGTALQAVVLADSEQRNWAIIELLVEHGADPNVQGKYGTILHLAAHQGHVSIVGTLLKQGVDPNVQANNYGTALLVASRVGHVDVVKLLLAKGADLDIQANDGSALHSATRGGHAETVEALLANGADINVHDNQNHTALAAALHVRTSSEYKRDWEVIKLLVERGADLSDTYGMAVHTASLEGNQEIVTWLLAIDADIQVEGGKYGAALQAACWSGNLEVINLVLDRGADPNIQGKEYYGTALQAASWLGQLEVTKLLLDRGADVNMKGEYGTSLQAACWFGELDIVKLLLERGADPNIAGGEYGTALQAAKNNRDIESLLLSNGANSDSNP